MNRSRRELLATLAAGSALVAGCVDDGSDDEPENGDGTDETADQPDTAGLDNLPEEGYPGTCPAYETARVICYEAVVGSDDDAVGVESVPAILEPSTRSFAPGESVEFVLSNQSDAALSTNFYNWRLDKQVDGEWYHVAPFAINEPMMSVSPGESHAWSVQIDNSGIEDGELVPRASGTDDLTLAGVGGGRYAFRARGWFEDHEDSVAFAATVEYEGDPLELTTTTLIGEVAFEGETLVAESTATTQANEAYVLERVEGSAEEADGVITEQLLRTPPRRDAVALAEEYDADRVRLDGYTPERYVRDPLGRFRYQGQQYELTKQGED